MIFSKLSIILLSFCEFTAIITYKLLSRIPLKLLYRIISLLSNLIDFIGILPFQKMVKKNLSIAFPDKSEEELKNIARAYYERAGEFCAENLYLLGPYSNDDLKVSFINLNVLTEAFVNNDFIICYSGHFLNYELLIQLPKSYPQAKLCCFYQPSGLTRIDSFVQKRRSKNGAEFIPTTSPLKQILSLYHNNTSHKKYIIGILGDLVPPKSNHIYNMFSRKISVFTGGEKIGKKINAAFCYASVIRKERGSYEISLSQLNPKEEVEIEHSVTNLYVKSLQDNIIQNPSIWMLWGTNRFEL